MKKWIIGICLLFSAPQQFARAGSCFAQAHECTANCSMSAPAGGDICCYEHDYFVVCQQLDDQDNVILTREVHCIDGGGSGDFPGGPWWM